MDERSGYLCFSIIAKTMNAGEADDQIRELFERYSGKYDTEKVFLLACRKYGLKCRNGRMKTEKIRRLTIPVIAKTKDGRYVIAAAAENGRFLLMDPLTGERVKKDAGELKEILSGDFTIISRRKGGEDESVRKFGFSWFIPTILKYRRQFISVLVAVLFIQILGIATPLMTQVVIDKVLTHHAVNTLYTIAAGILIVYIYELIISLCKGYLFVHTTNRIDVVLSSRLIHHLYRLPLKYFESRRVGETVARVRELDQIRSFLTGTPLSSLIDLFFIIVYISVMFLYSSRLTWIVIASLPVFAVLSLVTTPLFKRNLDRKFETGARTQSFLVESINGIHTVKSFALEDRFEDKWGELEADYVKAGYKTSIIAQTSNAAATFIQQVTDLAVLVVGAQAVINADISIGQLVAFRMLAGRVSSPILRLVQLWRECQQASLSVQKIGDIFNSPAERKSGSRMGMAPAEGRISFDKVSFRYLTEGSNVLQDISFELEPGKIYGMAGRSGSGKSTIAKLLQRLYVPQSGRISIDGMDLSLADPQQLRKQTGVVLQENFVFNGTVTENISIHCEGMPMEKIVTAARSAGAHDFIMELPDGYDTVIGEKGIALSGGQKQRLAIARAIINDPRILIFDEATSALDYESESIIQNNLREICRGRTVLIIAHRLSTLSLADKIFVIERGRVAESGSHAELMRQGGLYAHLYESQRKGEVV